MDNYNGLNEFQQDYTYGGVDSVSINRVMVKTFLFTFIALAITAATSIAVNPMVAIQLVRGGTFFGIFILEIAIVLGGNFAISRNIPGLAAGLYVVYSIINGVTLSIIFLAYTASSITAVFFITASMFGIMALIGATTKMDLSGIGSICIMGLLGIIIASVVNMFMKSTAFDFVITFIGIFIFIGLTAWDVQRTKRMVEEGFLEENSIALFSAFNLYLDFINLFLKLLRLMGKRR